MCCAGSSPDATNDLHPWNVLGDGAGDARFYDWGDCVVAHPFAAMLVPLGFLQHVLGVSVDDPDVVRARHAYLRVFAGTAPGMRPRHDARGRMPRHEGRPRPDVGPGPAAARDDDEELDEEWRPPR